jgi:hypothetical protein
MHLTVNGTGTGFPVAPQWRARRVTCYGGWM